DRIRVATVTGVQTCALPISSKATERKFSRWFMQPVSSGISGTQADAEDRRFISVAAQRPVPADFRVQRGGSLLSAAAIVLRAARSEERRVGKGASVAWVGMC